MNVEVGKAQAPETPASVMADQIMSNITELMMLVGGIESISATKYVCGFGSKLHVTINQFQGVPKDVAAQGVAIKDAIAQIMSVANIAKVVTKPSDEDLENLRSSWRAASLDANNANGGSGQDFSGGGSEEGNGKGD